MGGGEPHTSQNTLKKRKMEAQLSLGLAPWRYVPRAATRGQQSPEPNQVVALMSQLSQVGYPGVSQADGFHALFYLRLPSPSPWRAAAVVLLQV